MEANETMHERLSTLWNQGSKDLAVAFFRRAISLDMTLAELATALQFDHVVGHLANIRLRDILARAEAPTARPQPAVKAPVQQREPKRSRRSPAQSRKVRTMLFEMISAATDGIDTRQLSSALVESGISIDVAKCNMVLKDMERGMQIVGDDGRPRVWRLKVQGRAVAEPIVIRKSQESAAQSQGSATAAAPTTTNPGTATSSSAATSPSSVSLLSQSEVKSAADVLRAHFFSAKTHG